MLACPPPSSSLGSGPPQRPQDPAAWPQAPGPGLRLSTRARPAHSRASPEVAPPGPGWAGTAATVAATLPGGQAFTQHPFHRQRNCYEAWGAEEPLAQGYTAETQTPACPPPKPVPKPTLSSTPVSPALQLSGVTCSSHRQVNLGLERKQLAGWWCRWTSHLALSTGRVHCSVLKKL